MLGQTAPNCPLALSPIFTTGSDILRNLGPVSFVSVAQLQPDDASNDAVDVVTSSLDLLPSLHKLSLIFPFRIAGWGDSVPPPSDIVRSTASLRHVSIGSATSGAITSLLDRTPTLEYLALGFSHPFGFAEPRFDSKSALPCLRRLVLSTYTFDAEPHIASRVLEYSMQTLCSLSVMVSFQKSFKALKRCTDANLATALVHLDLLANYYMLHSCFDGCKRDTTRRDIETRQACGFIQACPRLAHLSLRGFHTEDLSAILDAVSRPLVSLVMDSKRCNIAPSTVILSLLERNHRSMVRLRLLALDRPASDTDWMLVHSLCRQRRTVMREYGQRDLIPPLGRNGTWVTP